MSHDLVEVDIWPPGTSSLREEVGFLQILVSVSLILKSVLLFSSCSLLTISILFQVYIPISWHSMSGISVAITLVPITCISLIADSLHFRMKFANYRRLLILLTFPFWLLGGLASVFELVIAVFLITLISQNSHFLVYLLIVNHVVEVSLILSSIIISLVAWRLISLKQTFDGVTDVKWNVDDVITYAPRY